MSKPVSIRKNYILNTSYQILALIIPVLTAPYVARVFGADGVGDYDFTQSVVGYFMLLAALGTLTYGQRTVAQCRDDRRKCSKVFWEIELLSVFTTGIALVVWAGLVLFSGKYRLYYALLTFELLSVAFDISWLFAGLERFTNIVFRNLLIKLVGVSLLFILIREKGDLWLYICLTAVIRLLGNASMWLSLRGVVDPPKLGILKPLRHLKHTFAYFIPTIAASVYSYLDRTMIGLITHDSFENGYYHQAMRIVQVAYTAIISLNTVMSARLSYLFAANRREEILEKLEMALAYILTVGIPMAVGLFGVADGFVPWFLGGGFEKSILLMKLLSPMVVILSLHNFLSAQYLVPSGQRVRSTKGVIAGAVVNFCCNLLLIPLLKSVGAVVATLVAESTICAIYLYMSKEYISLRMMARYLPKQLLSAAAMLGVVRLIAHTGLRGIPLTLIQVAAGGCVYLAGLLITRERFTLRMTKSFMKRAGKRRK